MANFEFPVKPGDVLEFEIDGVTVRGDVFSVSFYPERFRDATAICYIDNDDVFTANCRKCKCDKRTKCKFYSEKDGCILSRKTPVDIDEITADQIGTKYKKVRASWNWGRNED